MNTDKNYQETQLKVLFVQRNTPHAHTYREREIRLSRYLLIKSTIRIAYSENSIQNLYKIPILQFYLEVFLCSSYHSIVRCAMIEVLMHVTAFVYMCVYVRLFFSIFVQTENVI